MIRERRGEAGGGRRDPFRSVDPVLVALSAVAWGATGLHALGLVDLAGLLSLGLYPYYSIAAALGWLTGNYVLLRGRFLPPTLGRGARIAFLIGLACAPPGLVLLLRAMAPAAQQAAAPLVPIFALGVFTVFLLVPVILRPPRRLR